MTRDQLKAAAAKLVATFDTMEEDLWIDTMEMGVDVEISCLAGNKRVALTIVDAEAEPHDC